MTEQSPTTNELRTELEELRARVAELETERDQLESERDEYLATLQRVAADFDNYRKRAERDQESLVARAGERLVKELLPVLDDLERALEAANAARGGEARGGRRARAPGARARARARGPARDRDRGGVRPAPHEALLSQPSDADEGFVIQVLQKGYSLGDKVLRPARVVVAAPKEPRRSGLSTLYEVLGVAKNASPGRDQEGVPQARAPVPPGPNPGDKDAEERFKEVQGAYDVLCDPEKRKQYDSVRLGRGRGGAGGDNGGG